MQRLATKAPPFYASTALEMSCLQIFEKMNVQMDACQIGLKAGLLSFKQLFWRNVSSQDVSMLEKE